MLGFLLGADRPVLKNIGHKCTSRAMKLVCNIDQRGRRARIVSGAVTDACGALLLMTGVLRNDFRFIVVGAVVSVAGLFAIFEGVKGWCALRALGFKTKI